MYMYTNLCDLYMGHIAHQEHFRLAIKLIIISCFPVGLWYTKNEKDSYQVNIFTVKNNCT